MTSNKATVGMVLGVPATFDQAGFEALTYQEYGELTNVPQFGATATIVESNPLKTAIVQKCVGFVNFGSTTLEADYDDEDAGQELAANAVLPSHASFGEDFSFVLTLGTGTKYYWTGKFSGAPITVGSANSMVTTSATVEINSEILKVAAP